MKESISRAALNSTFQCQLEILYIIVNDLDLGYNNWQWNLDFMYEYYSKTQIGSQKFDNQIYKYSK